jgi:F-type H+/Na+-transporting ATPase subunit alpha
MSDLTITPGAISEALRKNIESWKPSADVEEIGRVLETGDGIARISGLPNCLANEILEFPHGLRGLAFNLEEHVVGSIVLGDASQLHEGDPVRQTKRILSVSVGDGLLGRVVNALGEPIDDAGPIEAEAVRPLEVQAASVVERQPVTEPLQTGIKAVDSMTNVGRGQRELIIGDRQTGKTAIGIDAIINQRRYWGTKDQVKCIYVAVGQKSSSVREIQARLEEAGAMEYTVIVVAGASDPAPFRYLAPYAGAAIGAHWMYKGEHALVVYDDLSKQADAYRQLSLLLRRPPGREAYPGDVFYLHSRLLERAAKLSDELGAGSLTALPIIETKGGDISGFIPTNVISITDGQIFLETDLFYQGVLPAVNVGTSVSRVGGAAQVKAMRKIAGRLRLDLAAFRELEAFAQFGSDLDKSSQDLLNRGRRLVEIMKQGQFAPLAVEEQVLQIFAGTGLPDANIPGMVDDVAVEDVQRFITDLTEYVKSRHANVLDTLRDSGELPDELARELARIIGEFKSTFSSDKKS